MVWQWNSILVAKDDDFQGVGSSILVAKHDRSKK